MVCVHELIKKRDQRKRKAASDLGLCVLEKRAQFGHNVADCIFMSKESCSTNYIIFYYLQALW